MIVVTDAAHDSVNDDRDRSSLAWQRTMATLLRLRAVSPGLNSQISQVLGAGSRRVGRAARLLHSSTHSGSVSASDW